MKENPCKICRRAGVKLFLKGERCYLPKCSMVRRPYPPGVHGQKGVRLSDYGKQLREKQKLRYMYGVSETQLKNYFKKAAKSRQSTIEKLFQMLEMRLDNVVFRAGFATSRKQARQLVNHGKVTVDGQKVDIPSYQVKPGQTIACKLKIESSREPVRPAWIRWDSKKRTATVERLPQQDEFPSEIDGQLIVEYYSR